mgnify:FL=1
MKTLRSHLSAEGLSLIGYLPEDRLRNLSQPGSMPSTTGLPDTLSGREAETADFVAQGHHGHMDWLARNAAKAYRPSDIMPGTRSIVVVGLSYYRDAPWPRPALQQQATTQAPDGLQMQRGQVARYAWGRDYHKTIGKALNRVVKSLAERHPGASFRAFSDATPLAERHFAEAAGIGRIGRNTLLMNREL